MGLQRVGHDRVHMHARTHTTIVKDLSELRKLCLHQSYFMDSCGQKKNKQTKKKKKKKPKKTLQNFFKMEVKSEDHQEL